MIANAFDASSRTKTDRVTGAATRHRLSVPIEGIIRSRFAAEEAYAS